jgi:acyl carrier protein
MSTVKDLKEVLAGLIGDPELAQTLHDTASLLTDVSLDSLELLQFMLEIEASLGIEVDFERLSYEHLGSLVELASFLDSMPRLLDSMPRQ